MLMTEKEKRSPLDLHPQFKDGFLLKAQASEKSMLQIIQSKESAMTIIFILLQVHWRNMYPVDSVPNNLNRSNIFSQKAKKKIFKKH